MGDQRGNVPYGARGTWHRFDITHTGTGRYCTYRFCAFGGTASRGQLPIRIIAHARHREGWRLVRAPCTGVFFFFFQTIRCVTLRGVHGAFVRFRRV